MDEKDPTTFHAVTYAWVFGLASMGGISSYFRKLKEGHARAFSVCEFIGELVTSAFAGVITFFLCQSAHLDQVLSAAFVGIAGHMGSRAIMLLEKLFEKNLPSK